MGLDINAFIKTKAARKIENAYRAENWPKVENGLLDEMTYFRGYPHSEQRWIDVTEFGIRNMWGLMKFFVETFDMSEEEGFYLTREQIEKTKMAALARAIPGADNCFCYESKCDELAAVCDRALNECNFDEELVGFGFCY